MGMFDNYPQPSDYVPDNRPRKVCCERLDEIVIGGTAIHTFKLTFSYVQLCSSFKIFYRQSVTDMLVIDSTALGAPYTMSESDGNTFITVTLSPAATGEFVIGRSTSAQIRLVMKDGSVIYGNINRIEVRPTLG